LEVRIQHALKFVESQGGKAYKANPWSHPALAWVEDEEIELPAQFRKGKPGRANYRPPSSRLARLAELGLTRCRPLPLAVSGWFASVGCVSLAGTHPVLNRGGEIAALRVTPETIEAVEEVGAGENFVAAIRHAFAWGGFPGWAERTGPPERELAWLRSKLLPL